MSDVRDGNDVAIGGAGPGPSWPVDGFTSGDTDVDVVLARLAQLAGTPVTDHSGLYSDIADGLLAELDQGRQE